MRHKREKSLLYKLAHDPTHIRRYSRDLKGFGAVDELVSIVTGGVPVNAAATGADLERALRYAKHLSVTEHLPAVWKTIGEDVRCHECLVIQKSAAHEITNLRVAPFAAVVTHEVRIINDLSFDEQRREKKGGCNGDTNSDTVPPCLCALTLPELSS